MLDLLHWLLKIKRTYAIDINNGNKKIFIILLPSTITCAEIEIVKDVLADVVTRLNIDTNRFGFILSTEDIDVVQHTNKDQETVNERRSSLPPL